MKRRVVRERRPTKPTLEQHPTLNPGEFIEYVWWDAETSTATFLIGPDDRRETFSRRC